MCDKSAREILTFYRVALRSSREVTFHPFHRRQPYVAMSSSSNPNSSTGLASNVGAGLCALIPLIGGLIFYFIEKKDRLVRHWAVESIFFGGAIIVISIVVAVIAGILEIAHIGFLAFLLYLAWKIFYLVLWILGLINGFQGKHWEYPIISEQCKRLFPKLVP